MPSPGLVVCKGGAERERSGGAAMRSFPLGHTGRTGDTELLTAGEVGAGRHAVGDALDQGTGGGGGDAFHGHRRLCVGGGEHRRAGDADPARSVVGHIAAQHPVERVGEDPQGQGGPQPWGTGAKPRPRLCAVEVPCRRRIKVACQRRKRSPSRATGRSRRRRASPAAPSKFARTGCTTRAGTRPCPAAVVPIEPRVPSARETGGPVPPASEAVPAQCLSEGPGSEVERRRLRSR